VDVKRWIRLHWDRLSAWVLTGTGIVVLLIGWRHIAGTPFPAEQVPYLVSAGIGGGLMVIFGAALLISADLRDEWHKLDRIESVLRSSATNEVASNGQGKGVTRLPDDSAGLASRHEGATR
jgi:hypothetical protein